MINARKKILKEKGAAPTELEEEVAKALFEIEVKNRIALVVHVPYRVWKSVCKIQGRLIRELEKKFSKKHVIFVAKRTILDKNFRRKGLNMRPRSRTLTSVHESVLEDIVGPTEVFGKRTRIAVDGSKLLKVILDPK